MAIYELTAVHVSCNWQEIGSIRFHKSLRAQDFAMARNVPVHEQSMFSGCTAFYLQLFLGPKLKRGPRCALSIFLPLLEPLSLAASLDP